MPNGTCSVPGCDRKLKGRGYCDMHLGRLRRRGSVDLPKSPSIEERFWSKVDKSAAPRSCWPWLDHTNANGYGIFFYSPARHNQLAHRVAFELTVGEIPTGETIDHLCHTHDLSCRDAEDCSHRRCVNPAHMEPVTRAENSRRGRGSLWQSEKTRCPQGHAYAEHGLVDRGHRVCRPCRREAVRKSMAKSRAKARLAKLEV